MNERGVAAVLTYNSEAVIDPCLNALQTQGWDILVVDNGSVDNTLAAVKVNYPRVSRMQTGDNLGYAGGYNLALKRLSSEGVQHVALVNPDAIVMPGCLDALSAAFANDPSTIITSPLVTTPDGKVDMAGGHIDWENLRPVYYGRGCSPEKIQKDPYKVELASGACMMLSMQGFVDLGPMEERYFLYWEETDYCLNAKNSGYTVYCEPNAEVVHAKRRSSSSMTDFETTYYYTRNALHCAAKYRGSEYVQQRLVTFILNQVEYQCARPNTQLRDELTSVVAGVRDYQQGVFGRSTEHRL